jgi:hypothetical protein
MAWVGHGMGTDAWEGTAWEGMAWEGHGFQRLRKNSREKAF